MSSPQSFARTLSQRSASSVENIDSEVMTVTPHDQMYTPTQVPALLQLSRTKTYQLLATGEIGSVLIGRCRRIPVGDLEDFIAARRTVS